MKVGVVGLGRMGNAMAARLLAAGHDLIVYDPFPAAAVSLGEKGARIAKDLAEVCDGREVVMSVLPTDQIFEDVVTGPGGLAESLSAHHSGHGDRRKPSAYRLHLKAPALIDATTTRPP